MGFKVLKPVFDPVFTALCDRYDVWAPVVKKGEGTFSDIDVIRYDKINSLDEIEWNRKSDYSFKEVLNSINETLFYFTEDRTSIPGGPAKDILIFLRSCDLHAVKRLDQIYLDNRYGDFYYARIREKVRFILMGCEETCRTGFCVSMGTNISDNYDAYIKPEGDSVYLDIRDTSLLGEMQAEGEQQDVKPDYVTENIEKVSLPENTAAISKDDPLWAEYGDRCISCGRCNFVCPTCTCFTMQDIFYRDNARAGERRRVWASCQVDGYSDIAGGISFRKNKADRVRFKVLHKIHDFKERFGYTMCVGCGRCDAVCPEYISYVNLVNRLAKEEKQHEK